MKRVNGQNIFVTAEDGGAIAGVRVPEGLKLPLYVKPNIGDLIDLVLGDKTAVDRLTIKKDAKPTPQIAVGAHS
jgi:hypothetical protein